MNKKLTKPVQLTILHTVLQWPDLTQTSDGSAYIYTCTGIDVSVLSCALFLKESNFTHHKMQKVAAQQAKELHKQFFYRRIYMYVSASHICFVDKTGSDCRNAMRRFGYGLRGKPPHSCKL